MAACMLIRLILKAKLMLAKSEGVLLMEPQLQAVVLVLVIILQWINMVI